ncbi:hypothetical protein [Occultella kanbiaonis]|uniref:hypothetical protein n=1 Tax=Occultella kanbiaonis TaxID=2675754 RepID=UPI0012B9F69E|nr:hypothetical protein [Occultella kanbiaonis]
MDATPTIGQVILMPPLAFSFAMGDVVIGVAERAAERGVFDVSFSPEPTVGPAGFTIGFFGDGSAAVSRTHLAQQIRRTVAGYSDDELNWS